MSKQQWTQEKINQYIREGRGQGIGSNYQPWTKTNEFSSIGRVSRVFGIKTQRIHHLQSDNQFRAFLIFEWCDKVIDIRESFPLVDFKKTVDDVDDLRFDKFTDKTSGVEMVLTTNFVLTVKNEMGNEVLYARSIKNQSELSRSHTIERLEMERRYWNAKGIDWKIITNHQIPKQFAKNLEWVRETLLDSAHLDNEKYDLPLKLESDLLQYKHLKLRDVLSSFDRHEGIERGTGLYLFRYLIAKKRIRLNLNEVISTTREIKDLIQW